MPEHPKILIVEDEGVVALNLQRKLEKMGFVVTSVADNHDDALRLATETHPDLVMMDIVIQGAVDGIETAQQLRLQQDVPVVFLTAHSDEHTIERAKAALPYGYLVKPFEERELRTTIEMALYKHEAQATERFQQQAIALVPVGIAIVDAQDENFTIVMCNLAFQRQMGHVSDDLKGQSFFSICDTLVEADGFSDLETRLLQGETGQMTLTCYDERDESHVADIYFGAIRDGAGKLTHYFLIVQDITERVFLEHLANRKQRLETIGTLVGGIVHDLNNILTPITMGSSLLEAEYPEATEISNLFRMSAERGTSMVRQLLGFAKGSDGEEWVVLRPKQLVDEIGQLMARTFPKHIELELDADVHLPLLIGDATLLHQVLLNLCVNARDAMPHGGKLLVCARFVVVDEVLANNVPDAEAGPYVAFEVRDTGIGMSPETMDRMFDPFFSTKPLRKGTGLGLSTVAGIVKGHNGFVLVSSREGHGTSIVVHLPINREDSIPENREIATVPLRGQGEYILWVEDDGAVRNTVKRALEKLNFRPIIARNGLDGLEKLQVYQDDICVVISDLDMPEMGGRELVEKIKGFLPDMPIVVSSGRLDDIERDALTSMGVSMFLDKPFTDAELQQVLFDVLKA